MARLYPTYDIANVLCDDPSGRWELLPGTALLPAFPGFRVTNYTVPGMVGNRAAAYAPGEASTFQISLRFNAVTELGKIEHGIEARVKAITANIDLFMQTTALARSGYMGLVNVKRRLSAAEDDHRMCSARVVSSSTPTFDPYRDYAEMTFIFENPTGTWRSPKADVTSITALGGQTSKIVVPMGTAPCNNAFIAIKGPFYSGDNSPRIAINNGHSGQGFRIGMAGRKLTVTSDRWLVINTNNWTVGTAYIMAADPTPTGIPWECAKPDAGYLEPQGRPMGSALTILPEATPGTGWVHIYTPGQLQVSVRSTKTWY